MNDIKMSQCRNWYCASHFVNVCLKKIKNETIYLKLFYCSSTHRWKPPPATLYLLRILNLESPELWAVCIRSILPRKNESLHLHIYLCKETFFSTVGSSILSDLHVFLPHLSGSFYCPCIFYFLFFCLEPPPTVWNTKQLCCFAGRV